MSQRRKEDGRGGEEEEAEEKESVGFEHDTDEDVSHSSPPKNAKRLGQLFVSITDDYRTNL